jgi:hypothetical protein
MYSILNFNYNSFLEVSILAGIAGMYVLLTNADLHLPEPFSFS